MNEQILEKIREVFPQLDFNEVELETQRHRIMRDFYYTFFFEFEVDVDQITRVQLCQNISGDDDMIPSVNLMCCVNALIPGSPVGLFDLITPTSNFMWKKLDLSLQYYEFSDALINALYDSCEDFVKSKKNIKELEEAISELEESTDATAKRVVHETKLIDEIEAECSCAEELGSGYTVERRAIEHKLQEAIAKKEMLLRKQQQASSLLQEKKQRLDLKKSYLNRSFDCDEQIKKLKEELLQTREKHGKYNVLIDEEKQLQSETTALNECLNNRCTMADQLIHTLGIFKELQELKKTRDADKGDCRATNRLDEVNKDIATLEKDNDILLKANVREIEMLHNSVNRKREFEDNKCKLMQLKSEIKDVNTVVNRINQIQKKEKELTKLFQKEEDKLKQMENQLVGKWMKEFNMYKETAAKTIKESKNNLY